VDRHSRLGGLSDSGAEADRGAPLQDGDPSAIDVKFPLADDFFNDAGSCASAATARAPKRWYKTARREYYEAARWTPGGFLWIWRSGRALADPD
jgi:hypothetical protein